uniref:Uncharacterized protein n=1 Tax=Rousettus aegyptiacus TaxID=9407 RepID=A0A7J8BF66_ROUAE|nr:hypothetical protein HJG63_009753 [Rousettus aegyptiacus]
MARDGDPGSQGSRQETQGQSPQQAPAGPVAVERAPAQGGMPASRSDGCLATRRLVPSQRRSVPEPLHSPWSPSSREKAPCSLNLPWVQATQGESCPLPSSVVGGGGFSPCLCWLWCSRTGA